MEPPSDTGGTASASASGSGASARSAGGAEAPPTSSSSAQQQPPQGPQPLPPQPPSRYESQKRRDWNTFLQYLRNHKPPLTLQRCSGAHVIEFLRYLDQFGKTKVHADSCPHFGKPNPPEPCACPLKQAWGSLDALIGRLRAAYEESGGRPESNPFAARAVRMYLREVRESQAKARGIPYEKKKRKRSTAPSSNPPAPGSSSGATSSAPPESSATPEKPELSEEGTPDEERPSPSPRAMASATVTVTTAATGTTAAAGATTSRREAKGKGRSSSGGS